MGNRDERSKLLTALLDERILVLDGAMGTMIQRRNPSAADFGGPALEGCNEVLVLRRPDIIRGIHREYLAAGADIVETDTFGGTPLVLNEYGLADKCFEINSVAAKLARQAADEFSTPAKPRFVAGSMGPTTKVITVSGGVTFAQLIEHFYQQARGLAEGGADILLVETCQDTRNIKAALIGIQKVFDELGYKLPIMVSGTIEPMGTMLAGQAADALVASLQHVDLLSIGLNCATGPEFMTDHIRTIHQMANTRVSCYPNAGLPNEEGLYLETPTSLASALERFVKNGWLNIVGGCCGTTPPHIKAIAQMVEGKVPRRFRTPRRSWYSGVELVEATDDNRPLIVGERTNEVGSRAFKRLITEEKFEEATEIARVQVKSGAHIIDINLENTDRDELADIDRFYEKVIHKVKVPFMIDTTNAKAIERALTYCLGKSIINSINFEDGEERFHKVLPLVKKFGAAIVIGSIDEDKAQAQAITRERKLAIAQRAHKYCVDHGIAEEDLIFDALVFPCATGDENYIGSAVETIEGVRLIKQALPKSKTVLGVSNVSFGLPPAAREVINSVFLYHATKAGLDLAIVNAEKLERYATIPDKEKKLVEQLLWNRPFAGYDAPEDYRQQTREQRVAINQHHIAAVNEHFRGAESRVKKKASDLPLDARLANYILEGSKEGLVDDLNLKLKEAAPLDIINGPLMDGMKEVGRLFNANELIVAEVLQSAEAMKAAVAHLEQFMERKADSTKGKVILATVKGDVHDIGKNLVEIILSNNGFRVINLGIKVPPEDLIKAYREHKPDAIGLSGLLVKSAQQMVVTAGDLKQAGITVPLLVGGAALSDKFTRTRIAPAYSGAGVSPANENDDAGGTPAPLVVVYCKDAMTGLSIMNQLMDPSERDKLVQEHRGSNIPVATGASEMAFPETTLRSGRVRIVPVRPAPYPDRKVRDVPQLREIWEYINPQMLYVRHLGFKSNFEKALAARDPKALELQSLVDDVKAEAAKFMKVKAVWQFFEAEAEGNDIKLFESSGGRASPRAEGSGSAGASPSHTFRFHRQRKPDGLCLADYVNPPTVHTSSQSAVEIPSADSYQPGSPLPFKSEDSDDRDTVTRDSVALFVVGAGTGIRERSEEYKAKGEYLKSHALQALAIETAEACAEWLHRRIREDWGIPDPANMTMLDRFQARYQGKRYSFGYPACPALEDQSGIWKLIHPEDIDVSLTEGFMMEPEASVSALVFHHPDCMYFGVGETTE
ncbi:MAG TPA: methionine synthase [Verrucomicrobiae bacterium]|nr:methionine synthase [Verrucomicrobiae bacterium]